MQIVYICVLQKADWLGKYAVVCTYFSISNGHLQNVVLDTLSSEYGKYPANV